MSTAAEKCKTLWYVEFRTFDYHTPLRYIPVQKTYARGNTEQEAKDEVIGWAAPVWVEFIAVERAPEWMQKSQDLALKG